MFIYDPLPPIFPEIHKASSYESGLATEEEHRTLRTDHRVPVLVASGLAEVRETSRGKGVEDGQTTRR